MSTIALALWMVLAVLSTGCTILAVVVAMVAMDRRFWLPAWTFALLFGIFAAIATSEVAECIAVLLGEIAP